MPPHPVEIVAYDPAWPALFTVEASRIAEVLGLLALRIDHVGSTAVPGLGAKPVIDVQVSVASLEPRRAYVELLGRIGYVHVPIADFDAVYPFFQKPAVWPSTHHLHLCVSGSIEERNHLVFRDYLRAHPETAAAYESLKRTLVATLDPTSPTAREDYSLAKTPFIAASLDRALAEGYGVPPRRGP